MQLTMFPSIAPRRPMESLCIGRLNGKDRGEPLNWDRLADLDDARQTIEGWRLDYDKIPPHSALGHLRDGLAFRRSIGRALRRQPLECGLWGLLPSPSSRMARAIRYLRMVAIPKE